MGVTRNHARMIYRSPFLAMLAEMGLGLGGAAEWNVE